MRKLDQRGIAALEFCLVAVPFFILMFAIFDFGRYAITMQSLRRLADAGARTMMIECYTPAVTTNTSPAGCTDINTYLTKANISMNDVAPFLYAGGLTPSLKISAGATALTVTASQDGFSMLMPIWGTALNKPSASTLVPF
jgi:Flp pilus assembly protein TadG